MEIKIQSTTTKIETILYMSNEKIKTNIKCLAIDQYVTSNIVEPKEIFIKDKGFVAWGESNSYPDYLDDLYMHVSTLHSIIDGLSDYIYGEGIKISLPRTFNYTNRKGQTLDDIVSYICKDLAKYNGFALNVLRSQSGEVVELHYIDFKRVRSNKDNTKYYYSTEWNKSFGRTKYMEFDSFLNSENPKEYSTIFYYKNDINHIYPSPLYAAAVVACEIEKQMNNYHLNNIANSFSANYIINFNNGTPSSEIQEEIEQEITDKFCGPENAARPILSFNQGKANETTVTKIETDSFVDKYNALAKRTQQEIFTSFKATPNLFGIPTETTGFSEQEYNQAYKLFNKTVVKPYQQKIEHSFDKIFGRQSVKIIPFALDALEEKNITE